jgi:hypothetical protein
MSLLYGERKISLKGNKAHMKRKNVKETLGITRYIQAVIDLLLLIYHEALTESQLTERSLIHINIQRLERILKMIDKL